MLFTTSETSRLISALSSPDSTIRYEAAVRLGEKGEAGATQALMDKLRDPNEYASVVQAAGLALGELDRAAIPALLQALLNEAEPLLVRSYAARALGKLHAVEALSTLLSLLKTKPKPNNYSYSYSLWHLREAAAEALGPLGQIEATSPLLAIVLDKQEDISFRATAAWSLGQLGLKLKLKEEKLRLREALERLMTDSSEDESLKSNLTCVLLSLSS